MDDGELDKFINELKEGWVQSLENSFYFLDFTNHMEDSGLQNVLRK